MNTVATLSDVHRYPPDHGAGAEWYLHHALVHAATHGVTFDHTVVTSMPVSVDNLDGIRVVCQPQSINLGRMYRAADVVITHLDRTRHAMALATNHRKPLVHLVHNDRQLGFHRVTPKTAQLVVFNSRWIADKLVDWDRRTSTMVLHPYTPTRDYEVDTTLANAVTLVNLAEAKGGPLFYELARRLPQFRFIGVTGAYAQQMPPPDLPNLTIVPNTGDMRSVYKQSRLVLMPSSYESWGRVAIEAAASGIPVIAHPTPGLTESLGADGLFADRDNPDEWERLITTYIEPGPLRAAQSDYLYNRARIIERVTLGQLAEFAERLATLAG